MIERHHPKCIGAQQRDEGPDEGEKISAFAARARGFRCTCRDHLALELAPHLMPFLRQQVTHELRDAFQAVVAAFVRNIAMETAGAGGGRGFEPQYDAVIDLDGTMRVRWYPQGRAAFERARAHLETEGERLRELVERDLRDPDGV